jgi:hypothetical protein
MIHDHEWFICLSKVSAYLGNEGTKKTPLQPLLKWRLTFFAPQVNHLSDDFFIFRTFFELLNLTFFVGKRIRKKQKNRKTQKKSTKKMKFLGK